MPDMPDRLALTRVELQYGEDRDYMTGFLSASVTVRLEIRADPERLQRLMRMSGPDAIGLLAREVGIA